MYPKYANHVTWMFYRCIWLAAALVTKCLSLSQAKRRTTNLSHDVLHYVANHGSVAISVMLVTSKLLCGSQASVTGACGLCVSAGWWHHETS